MNLPPSLEILRGLCEGRGLLFEDWDPFSAYIARVICPRTKAFFFVGAGTVAGYPGNDSVLAGIANDKAFTYAFLTRLGIAVPKGDYFFLSDQFADQRPPGKELDAAERYLIRHFAAAGAPLVIKPNRLSHARAVSLARDTREAMADLRAIAAQDLIGHVQELIEDPEFRLFLVKGEIVFAYRKGRPQICGDAKSTVATLTAGRRANPRYLSHILKARGLTDSSVLEEGASLPIDFIANLSARGQFQGFITPGPQLAGWARALFEALPLRVMGVDVFSASALADPNDFIVTDINASPSLTTLSDLGESAAVARAWDAVLADFSPG